MVTTNQARPAHVFIIAVLDYLDRNGCPQDSVMLAVYPRSGSRRLCYVRLVLTFGTGTLRPPFHSLLDLSRDLRGVRAKLEGRQRDLVGIATEGQEREE